MFTGFFIRNIVKLIDAVPGLFGKHIKGDNGKGKSICLQAAESNLTSLFEIVSFLKA
jgi:hypothetical protein